MTQAAFDSETVRIEHGDSISWLILNRPDQANAFNGEMLDALSDAFEYLKHAGASVIGLRGEGKGFCGGMDLTQYGAAGEANPVDDADRLNANLRRWIAIWEHPKPVIAAIHGYCMGVGAQLPVFTDLTIVADDAKIGEPKIPLGGGYIAPAWVSLVGHKRAKEFAFIPGNWIDGRTAVEWGWANHSVPAGNLIAAVEDLAVGIAKTPAEILAAKKRSINRAAEAAGFREALSGTAEIDALLHLAPSVLDIRKRMKAEGMKSVIGEFAGDTSIEIIRKHEE